MWLDDFVKAASEDWDMVSQDAIARRGVSEHQVELYRIGVVHKGLPEGIDYPESFSKWFHGKGIQNSYVIPLTSCTGAIRGLQFRSTDRKKPGYLDWFDTKSEAVFFGLAEAMPHIWKNNRVLLVEGAFDLFQVQRVFPGVICTLHAGVSPALWRVIRRVASHVTIGWDNDATGNKQAWEILKGPYNKIFRLDMITYPKERTSDKLTKDPEELWCIWGSTKLDRWLLAELAKTDPTYSPSLGLEL